MLVLDDKKGCGEKAINKFCFLPPPSREEEKGEKKREARGQKHHHFYIIFWGLKNGQEVAPPFLCPKIPFLKSAKTPILKHFQQKLVWWCVRKRAKQQMITVSGVFKFDAI